MLHNLKIKKTRMMFYGTACLFGAMGSLLVLLMMRFSPPINLGTVNVTGIVDQFISQESKKNLTKESLEKEVNQFGIKLDKEIKDFSQEHHVVLFLHEAVIANAHDYTEAIQKQMLVHQ